MDALLKQVSIVNGLMCETLFSATLGTATTTVDISGLNIAKGEDLILVMDLLGASNTTGVVYVNENYTGSNYRMEAQDVTGTTVSCSTQNSAVAFTLGTVRTLSYTRICLNNQGYFTTIMHSNKSYGGSGLMNTNINMCSTFTATSITSLRILASANMSIDSTIHLYKIVADKEANIVVGTATTQVDITGLNFDSTKDYLLVVDPAPHTSTSSIGAFVNDDLTTGNYTIQYSAATGTTISAGRSAECQVFIEGANIRGLSYVHLHLSNDGYYSSISHHFSGIGSTAPTIFERYSNYRTQLGGAITKISLRSTATNGIPVGSRFTLYKIRG